MSNSRYCVDSRRRRIPDCAILLPVVWRCPDWRSCRVARPTCRSKISSPSLGLDDDASADFSVGLLGLLGRVDHFGGGYGHASLGQELSSLVFVDLHGFLPLSSRFSRGRIATESPGLGPDMLDKSPAGANRSRRHPFAGNSGPIRACGAGRD